MTATSAAGLVEGYLARLRAELESASAADVEDTVAEIRSLLVDAAGDDAERASSEIESLGSPAQLVADILAERGLASAGGMPTAEWWRLGIAAPIDIVIGACVPAALLWTIFAVFGPADLLAAWPVSLTALVLVAASLLWPWWVWRPWRTGGRRATVGMALTGIAVVRVSGEHRVVRTRDLAALGLQPDRHAFASGLLTVLGVFVLLVVIEIWGAELLGALWNWSSTL